LTGKVAELERKKRALSDPAQIEAEARRRLRYVMPGETPYIVQLPGDAPTGEEHTSGGRTEIDAAWFEKLWAGRSGWGHRRAIPSTAMSREFEPVTEADREIVRQQLGRPPRAMRAIAARCPSGHPAVVQTSPRLEDGTPFPTLYYLTCPRLCSLVGRLEA